MNFILRFISRSILWKLFFTSFKGTSFLANLNLFLSALYDIMFYVISGWSYNPRTLFSGIYLVKGYNFNIFSRGGTDDLYHAIPGREGDINDLLIKYAKKGTVVDVGANIGYYTIIASKILGDEGKIFAIEPVPQTAAILKFNIKLNRLRNVEVIERAVWFKDDILKMRVEMGKFGSASVFSIRGREVEVQAQPLDHILANVGDIELMKIDIEGAEYEALLGAKQILLYTKTLIIELSRKREECLILLKKSGFSCKKAKFVTYYICYKEKNIFWEDKT